MQILKRLEWVLQGQLWWQQVEAPRSLRTLGRLDSAPASLGRAFSLAAASWWEGLQGNQMSRFQVQARSTSHCGTMGHVVLWVKGSRAAILTCLSIVKHDHSACFETTNINQMPLSKRWNFSSGVSGRVLTVSWRYEVKPGKIQKLQKTLRGDLTCLFTEYIKMKVSLDRGRDKKETGKKNNGRWIGRGVCACCQVSSWVTERWLLISFTSEPSILQKEVDEDLTTCLSSHSVTQQPLYCMTCGKLLYDLRQVTKLLCTPTSWSIRQSNIIPHLTGCCGDEWRKHK